MGGDFSSSVFCRSIYSYDANIAGNLEKYGSLKNYIIFDDDWEP